MNNTEEEIELNPNVVSDHEYFKMVSQLNREQEFHMHIMHQAFVQNEQVLCALHGGAGTGKSTVIRAVYHGLNRMLNKIAGSEFSKVRALLTAPTGKAAYNIKGTTIHRAFFISANQKLEFKPLSWDNLNTARVKLSDKNWIIVDEFSMVGNAMLNIMHLRLQEIMGNQLPFEGKNIIL